MAKGLGRCDSTRDLAMDRFFWKYPTALNRMVSVLIRGNLWGTEHKTDVKETILKQESGLTEGRTGGLRMQEIPNTLS